MSPPRATIPYVDLPRQNAVMIEDALRRMRKVLEHGQYILGPEVTELESQIAEYLGVAHVLGVNSGTDALILSLRAHGITEGDEVITSSHTFLATTAAICAVGATPVFADVDAETMVLCPTSVEDRITPRTRAILPVHLNGHPCDMPSFETIAARHSLVLVEDAAQALGASRDGRKVGSFGTGCFSLHPLKILGACGDAGLIATNDDDLAVVLQQLRNIGLRNRDEADRVGGNSRLDTLQAAILLAKLPYLERYIEARNEHARAYRLGLADLVVLPPEESDVRAVYTPFVIRLEEGRDRLQKRLAEAGVETKVHYPIPAHRQKPFARFHQAPLPVTERLVETILSLPSSPELEASERDRVIERIQEEIA